MFNETKLAIIIIIIIILIIISIQTLQEYKDIHNIVKTIPLHNFLLPNSQVYNLSTFDHL